MKKHLRLIYIKILFIYYQIRIKKYFGHKLFLVDIDFTLINHDLNKIRNEKRLSIDVKYICPKVLDLIFKKKSEGYIISIFTARGLASLIEIKKMIYQSQLDIDFVILLGSTQSKINFLNSIHFKFRDLILCDDLQDWDFHIDDFKQVNYMISPDINYIHPKEL